MHSLQPQSLTNSELERYVYATGLQNLPSQWATEMLRRTQSSWNAEQVKNPDQLELDFS